MKSLLSLIILMVVSSCAQIVMPSGGKKDTQPPSLMKTYPPNNSTMFKGDEIIFQFDEFFDIENPQKNIFISPYTPQKLEPRIIGKKLYLKFPEGLQRNTSYSIQLSNLILDFSEGNKLPVAALNFSTGLFLDSGKINLLAHEAKSKLNNNAAVATLVRSREDLLSKRYVYLAKMTDGIAKFSNLNNEQFYGFVFADSNSNMTWERTEPIGFWKNKLKAGDIPEKTSMFLVEPKKIDIQIVQNSPREYEILANKTLFQPMLSDTNYLLIPTGERTYKILSPLGVEKHDLKLYYDKTKTTIIDLPTTKKERIYIDILSQGTERMFDAVFPKDSVVLSFSSYIETVDTSRIKLYQDNHLQKSRIIISKNQLIFSELEENKTYDLTIDSLALKSRIDYNKRIKLSFSTYPKDKLKPIITIEKDSSLLQKTQAVVMERNGWEYKVMHQNSWSISNFYGDQLVYHIFIDENGNGIWDTGSVENATYPEPYYIETIVLEPKKTNYKLKISNP